MRRRLLRRKDGVEILVLDSAGMSVSVPKAEEVKSDTPKREIDKPVQKPNRRVKLKEIDKQEIEP